MAWKEMNIEELAESLGVSAGEIREKQKLVQLIVKTRKTMKMSQVELAKKLHVSQSRIAQIESGVGTSKVTFDILLHILTSLGYGFKIVSKKTA